MVKFNSNYRTTQAVWFTILFLRDLKRYFYKDLDIETELIGSRGLLIIPV